MPGPTTVKPLSPAERTAWNKFLRFVNTKGYTGNKDLDNRDQSLGESLMAEYNKTAGPDTVNAAMVPRVQQDFQYYGSNGNFPETNDFGNFTKILSTQVRQKDLSPVDGWFGSLTSQQAYPELKDTNGHDWGTDYNSFIENMKTRLGGKYASR